MQSSMKVICPRCGAENPSGVMNCAQCRINLDFARANPEIAQGLTREIKSENIVAEFLPSRRRYFSRVAIFLAVSALITLPMGYLLFGSVLLGSFVGAAFWIALREQLGLARQKITITDKAISGPATAGGKIVTIALEQIDRQKTERRGRLLKAEGSWYIHSINGDRLLLSGMAFDGQQIDAILREIGIKATQERKR